MNLFFIDMGSTFVKYAIYEEQLKKWQIDKVPFPKPLVADGVRYVVSAEKIKQLLLTLADYAQAHQCEKVLLSVQMHGYLLRSRAGVFSDYISWRDQSGETDQAGLQEINFFERGTSLKKNLPFVKLYGQNLQQQEFFTLGSYLSFLLTGNNVTHKTDACASGFYCADTLRAVSAPEGLILPRVCSSVLRIGSYKNMDIYAPVGDHQVSFLGSGASRFQYMINVGTATQITCTQRRLDIATSYEARPYFYPDSYLFTASGLTGGAELYEKGNVDRLFAEIKRAIAQMPAKNGVIIGGGGGPQVYEKLKERFAEIGLSCEMCENNVGLEGLKILAEKICVKAGTMLSEVEFSNFPLLVKNSHLDFFLIDHEHGSFDDHFISLVLMTAKLAGVKAIVRLSGNERKDITKFADAGAAGFLLPMTNDAADILQVGRYAMYAPMGQRGVSTTRAHTLYHPPKLHEYMEQANQRMEIYAQIETVKGIENIEAILGVPCVTGVMIGPNDLSIDLDCVGFLEPIKDCIQKVARAAAKAEKPWGIITTNRELIHYSLECGVHMISYGSELNMLNSGLKSIREMF